MRVRNDEMLSPRDFARSPAGHLDRLESGDVEKLVLTRASEMKFVVVTVDRYEELEAALVALVERDRGLHRGCSATGGSPSSTPNKEADHATE